MNSDHDSLAEFEEALQRAATGEYILKLYVTGSSVRSAQAIANVRSLCEKHLANRYQLEVIDVLQNPELARAVQLLAAPTLIKEQPEPVRRIVGDMSEEYKLLCVLNIDTRFKP